MHALFKLAWKQNPWQDSCHRPTLKVAPKGRSKNGRWGTGEGRRRRRRIKITKACVRLSVVFSTLLHKIPPSFIPGKLLPPPLKPLPRPSHWSAQPPPLSHKLPGSEPILGERGSQHQPPGTKEVGDDPQSLRWTPAGLAHSSALIISASCARPATP